jgi:hypothetical protein
MTDYINPAHLDNTYAETNSFLESYHSNIIATLIASFSAGWVATRRDYDILVPPINTSLNDMNFNISVLGNASTNYNIEVKNFETYYTGLATFNKVIYNDGIPSTYYWNGGLPTNGYPLLATYLVTANQAGAVGRVQDSRNITGMYIGVNPVGSTGGRLTISNAATLPAGTGETLYITIRKV